MPKPDTSNSHATPIPIPVSTAEPWHYKQGGSQSSTEGVSPPPPGTVDGKRDPKDDYHLRNAMENLKLATEGGNKKPDIPSDCDKSIHHSKKSPPQHVVDELQARIQHLEAELEVTRRVPDRRGDVHMEGGVSHYQSGVPCYYSSSPHSGEIMRGPNFSGPIPPHQYPQNQTTPVPVETGYYHPCEFIGRGSQ